MAVSGGCLGHTMFIAPGLWYLAANNDGAMHVSWTRGTVPRPLSPHQEVAQQVHERNTAVHHMQVDLFPSSSDMDWEHQLPAHAGALPPWHSVLCRLDSAHGVLSGPVSEEVSGFCTIAGFC